MAVTALLLAGLGACSATGNPVRDAFHEAGMGPKMAPAPDFVAQSRPKELDYMPIGLAAPTRAAKAKRPDEVKGAEAEMDALRTRNEALGAEARRAGTALKPAAAPSVPAEMR